MRRIENEARRRELTGAEAYRAYFGDRFAGRTALFSCAEGETFIRQGDPPDYLFFLAEGKCRVTAVSESGKLSVVNTLEAPCLVGEIELITGDRSFSVEAMEPCLLLALPVELARSELLEDAPFLLRLCETLADKERENAIRFSQLSGFPLTHRLAGFLLSNQQNGRVALKKTVIAESLGVSYRHLEKVMGDFVREGILDKNGRTYEIRGRERLEELAASLRIL